MITYRVVAIDTSAARGDGTFAVQLRPETGGEGLDTMRLAPQDALRFAPGDRVTLALVHVAQPPPPLARHVAD